MIIFADIEFGQALAGGALSVMFTITVFVLAGLVLWPRIANSQLRQLIPDDAEDLVDQVSDRVRSGLNQVTLPEDEELRFYWHLQQARTLATDQKDVLENLEMARANYLADGLPKK